MAKRETVTSRNRAAATALAKSVPAERVYASLDEELPTRREVARTEGEGSSAREKLSGSVMEEVFGPGGLLERCMIGGYEHRAAQLEMAELVHDAFTSKHHAVVEAGTGDDLQRVRQYLIRGLEEGRPGEVIEGERN